MTVQELIQQLQQYPPDQEVRIADRFRVRPIVTVELLHEDDSQMWLVLSPFPDPLPPLTAAEHRAINKAEPSARGRVLDTLYPPDKDKN